MLSCLILWDPMNWSQPGSTVHGILHVRRLGWVQFSSVTQSCLTLCDPMDCSTPDFPVDHHSWSLLKLMSIESVMPSNHLILCRPFLLPPSVFPSIRVFSCESVLCIRWPKHWSFNFSIRLSNEYSELISFRMDWFDLLAVQETLKSLLRHHSSKASILWHSAFFYPLFLQGIFLWATREAHYHRRQVFVAFFFF